MKLNMIIVDGFSVGPQLYNRIVEHYNPTLCPTGQALRSLLDRIVTDVFLINTNLLGMSGYDTCRMIRSNPYYAKVPIVFLANGISLDEKLYGYQSGGNAFIDLNDDADIFLHKLQIEVNNHLAHEPSRQHQRSRLSLADAEKDSWNALASHLSPILASADPEELAGRVIGGCEGFNLSNSVMFYLPTGSKYYSPTDHGQSSSEYKMLLEAKQGGDIIAMGKKLIFNSSHCNLLVRDKNQTILQTPHLASMMRILLRMASEKINGFVLPSPNRETAVDHNTINMGII
ncbi:response regulator [Oceanicoccus sagamiensis]|uniref:Response regulatory domain-containing protein n=1 Tax=Oceanicoccus sagamiensis TaxID=716816 RepID=A0A1X9NC82_9GAMM|nr:response regulator transcription factor [Oceanicoccus sagamiensis]ARN73515.1 hypothetical protein BST96_04910 [Oceanicoccus sagamiensis]